MTKTTRTNNKKIGTTIGFAAVAAILTVALLTTNISGQSAQAEPANKVTWMNDDVAIAVGWMKGNVATVNEVTLQKFTLKTSDKGDWLFDMAAECSTFTTIEAKGKKNDEFSGSTAGAVVTLYVDGEANKSWNLCQQDFQTKAYLNDAIIEDAEGNLKFNCDAEGVPTDPDTPCEQFISLYLLNAGSYNAKWVAANLSAGVLHDIEIKAVLNAGPSQLGDAPTESSGIDAGVIIGRNVVIAEPIHVAVGDF